MVMQVVTTSLSSQIIDGRSNRGGHQRLYGRWGKAERSYARKNQQIPAMSRPAGGMVTATDIPQERPMA